MSNRSGCAARLPQLIIIIVVASLLAVGIFLAIPYSRGRPEFPRGTFPVQIEGREVLVAMDPEREVMLVPPPGVVDPGTGGQSLVQLATGTPVVLPTTPPTATTQILPTPGGPTITPPTTTPRPSCVTFTNHTVQAGETLFSISRRYVTSVALMASHGISSVSLTPGAVLRVPVGDPSCCRAGWKPYVVEEGESWFGIARSCGITVDALLQGNGLSAGATLYMTSVICVPQ
jgi:LysM repeat protein